MFPFLLGLACLLAVMAALGMFSRANVRTLKQFGIWAGAIGGMLLALMLILSGRGMTAIWALVMLGPLVWSWVVEGKAKGTGPRMMPRPGPLSRAEAFEILGLKPGATEADIRAAHRRLMQGAHPDHGGSDWLAARINQARDVLLG